MISLVMVLVLSIIVPASFAYGKSKKVTVASTPTVAELEQKYVDAGNGKEKVHILIVPGHEPDFGGAEYQGVYEREITVETADELAAYLNKNPRLDVEVARSNAAWNDDLSTYFEDDWDKIEDFVEARKEAFTKLIDRGKVTERSEEDQVDHAAAPDDVALRLYGINKWANENGVDLVVHLHINDAPDHGPDAPSANSGYAVYVPDSQYGNASTSLPVGEAVAARLSAMNATSTLPVENKGVVEDQDLIALGAYDTLSVPSVLVEYAYITEPKFLQPELRQTITMDYAYETYLGLQDFFKDSPVIKYPTVTLPFTFATSSLAKVGSSSPATYALQAALHTLSFYPTYASTTPVNARLAAPTLTMCPIDGIAGPCTTNGIEAFQAAKGIPVTGALGPVTVNALNTLFSNVPVVPISVATPSSTTSGACMPPKKSLAMNAQDAAPGGDVSRLQTLLATDPAVYPEKLVTGRFGPATLAAVQKFQVTHKIAAKGAAGYGLVGPKTLAELQTAYCK
jgi:peptidoglycan hydrolase-like protein with peptidoglycan-binding domain/N-acetylmuramoyl-L-alanine amidase